MPEHRVAYAGLGRQEDAGTRENARTARIRKIAAWTPHPVHRTGTSGRDAATGP